MKKTIAITGASGQIGYALTFQLMHVLKEDTIRLHLIDLPNCQNALEALKMEVEDCGFKNLDSVMITTDLADGFKNVDWALLVGSMPRKEGMERSDLLKLNGAIFKKQGEMINEHARPTVKVLVIGNPCNTNALIASKHAPNIPDEQFFALTMLDQLRAEAQLAIKANAKVSDISDMIIFGNHSATQFPAYPLAEIAGKKATDVINDLEWFKSEFVPTIQKRGATVIKTRGASSAASAANAICETIRCVDHPTGEAFSLGVVSNGEYGAHPGLIVSYPCISVNGKITVQDQWPIDDQSKKYLELTFDELKKEHDQVESMGLLGS